MRNWKKKRMMRTGQRIIFRYICNTFCEIYIYTSQLRILFRLKKIRISRKICFCDTQSSRRDAIKILERRKRSEMFFHRKKKTKLDLKLDYVPFTFYSCNNIPEKPIKRNVREKFPSACVNARQI